MAMNELLEKKCNIAMKDIVVPKEVFIKTISERTGWSKHELETKDIGDIETRLHVRATQPNQSPSLKRGKSMNLLYKFEGMGAKERIKTEITHFLN